MTIRSHADSDANSGHPGDDPNNRDALSTFLSGLEFDRGAPQALRQAAAQQDSASFVRLWFEQLTRRIDSNSRQLPRKAFDWIAVQPNLSAAWRAATRTQTSNQAAQGRPTIGSRHPHRSPLPCLARLEPDASDGDLLVALALLGLPTPPHRTIQWLTAWKNIIQLTASRSLSPELAFTTGLLLAPLKGTARLRQDGRRALQEELLERTDTDGTPHAGVLADLPEWLGSLVRSEYWGRRLASPTWNTTAKKRFDRLVALTNSLYRHPNRLALSKRPSRGLRELLDEANHLATHANQPPRTQSDWAHVAMLQSDTPTRTPALLVTHDGPKPELDLSIDGRSLLQDAWSIRVTCGDSDWVLDDWTCVCWQSDDDADYIELQADAGQGRRVDRQILLSRSEELLVLADAVINTPASPDPDTDTDQPANTTPLTVRSSLGLAHGVVAGPARTGRRDWKLKGPGGMARILPLALPDDPLLATGRTSIDCHDSRLEWTHAGTGPALYLPLVIDFCKHRSRSRPEWNRLTVTENRQVASTQQAVGFRARLGDTQLVLYRSLAPPLTPRSVLGLHTQHETVIGLLESNGDFQALVMVESAGRALPTS